MSAQSPTASVSPAATSVGARANKGRAAQQFTVGAEKLTAMDIAARTGLSVVSVYGRLARGIRGTDLLLPAGMHPRRLTEDAPELSRSRESAAPPHPPCFRLCARTCTSFNLCQSEPLEARP